MDTVERRQVPRWDINKDTEIKLQGALNFAECRLGDISFKGLRISLAMKLPKDAFLKVVMVLTEEQILELEIWVVWHKTMDGRNVYGCYFSGISEADKEKIYKYIHKYCPDQLRKQQWRGIKKKLVESSGGTAFEDKRVFSRFPAHLGIKFLESDTGREGTALTNDVSARGLGVVLERDLSIQTPLELWLKIPDEHQPLYIRGGVAWSKNISPNEYRAGIKLDRPDLMGLSRVLRMGNQTPESSIWQTSTDKAIQDQL